MSIGKASAPTMLAPLGSVEPHAGLLTMPAAGQLLYKVTSIKNLLLSVSGSYLHFNRVDAYRDGLNADKDDGAQLPADRDSNIAATFEKTPAFSAADYYDRARTRTYASCFSLDNTPYIWEHYGGGDTHGKTCLVFDCDKLRQTFNRTHGSAGLFHGGDRYRQIFDINYGVVEYVHWDRHRANTAQLPNPIRYTFLKSNQYQDEREFRIALSALGIGQFCRNDGTLVDFPATLQLGFDFTAAFADGTIKQLLLDPAADRAFLYAELEKLGIKPVETS